MVPAQQSRPVVRLFLAILSMGVFLSCSAPAEQKTQESATTVSASAVATVPGAATSREPGTRRRPVSRMASAPGKGRLKLVYGKLSTAHRKEIAAIFKEERLFEDVLEDLNQSLVLSQNVEVRLEECKEVNAFYDPEQKAVLLCYELFDHFTNIFSEGKPESITEEGAEKAVAALVFAFYHEIGHALIDVYDLPVTGREEDAVDQLATVMLLETWDEEESQVAILSSAEWFDLDAAENDDPDMADEHSLDEQRYYNLVCWIYGSDPEYFSDVANEWGLPEARAGQCPSEYARMSTSWGKLLGPHMRPAPPDTAP